MKLAKSLLLGSAAALATVAGAQAADLPVRKAAPVAVEYVRVCSTYGAGFFVIPGTESCVKLTGRARAEVLVQERFSRAQDLIGLRARLRIGMDVRTPTPYGLLRTFVRIQGDSNSGTPYLGGLRGAGITSVDPAGQVTGDFSRVVNSVGIQAAYVQFGGLTAGFAPSFFANADLPTRHFGTLRFDDLPDITTFAYTHSFGNGFSVTAGIEDPYARRVSSGGGGFGAGFFLDPVTGLPITSFGVAPIPVGNRFVGINQGGQEAPNFVGNVKWAGTWGSLQLSGAVQQLTDIGTQAGGVTTRPAADDEIGFAVSGSGHFNLPMIAAGDAVWFNATYADGAVNYLTGGNLGTLGFATGNRPGLRSGDLLPNNLPTPDGIVRIAGNSIETTEAFSVAAGLRHFWVPGLESNLFGSWAFFDVPDFAEFRRASDATRFGLVDFTEWRVGTNLIWSPVSGLDLGVEVMYTRVEAENGPIRVGRGGAGAQLTTFRVQDDVDNLEGRIRVQRDF